MLYIQIFAIIFAVTGTPIALSRSYSIRSRPTCSTAFLTKTVTPSTSTNIAKTITTSTATTTLVTAATSTPALSNLTGLNDTEYNSWISLEVNPMIHSILMLSVYTEELSQALQRYRGGFMNTVWLWWYWFRVKQMTCMVTHDASHPRGVLRDREAKVLGSQLDRLEEAISAMVRALVLQKQQLNRSHIRKRAISRVNYLAWWFHRMTNNLAAFFDPHGIHVDMIEERDLLDRVFVELEKVLKACAGCK